MAHQWYYAKGGQRHGPVNDRQLKELAVSGQLKQGNLVWREGMREWVKASTIRGLFMHSSPANPPPLSGHSPSPQAPTASPPGPPPPSLPQMAPQKARTVPWKWIGIGVGTALVLLLVFGVIGQQAVEKKIAAADALWDKGEKEAAVKLHSAFHKPKSIPEQHRSRITGRMIEFHVSTNRADTAKTWCEEAIEAECEPALTTEVAKNLYAETKTALATKAREEKTQIAEKKEDRPVQGEGRLVGCGDRSRHY